MLALATALFFAFAPPAEGAPSDAEGGDVGAASDAEVAAAADPAGDADADPAGDAEAVEVDADVDAGLRATVLTLAPAKAGTYTLVDERGRTIAEGLALGEGKTHALQLTPGIYRVIDEQQLEHPLVVAGTVELIWDGMGVLPVEAYERRELQLAFLELALAQQGPPNIKHPSTQRPRRNRRVWASPLASTLAPGIGQVINGQGGKGVGLLFATVASLTGSIVLYNMPSDGTRPLGKEYARLIGYGVLSTAVPMLWIYAITDAYAHAHEPAREVVPAVDHKVRLSVNRTMTVGFRADVNRPGFYDNWSVSLMGQATRRLSVGVSDLSLAVGKDVDIPEFGQFGLRADYRVYDRGRLWIDLGLGVAMQVVSSRPSQALDPEVAIEKNDLRFGATPYGVVDLRVFPVNHLSLDFSPRLSVPVTTRWFSAGRALPRFAPNLELGGGVSVYF
ncbi:hypothetical protein G6O69_29535 [Pseudenhygromyxa sp. WMMC2535]|nr:hypothetical protein [Pseudenhygromyxa sp. WMMC2535]